MALYRVNLHREVRLKFRDIEADSADSAAMIARSLPIESAEEVGDCEGENFVAKVDIEGKERHQNSQMIAFEPELLRNAAQELLEACLMVVQRWERGDLAAAARACSAAIAQAGCALEGDLGDRL